jgi:tetratricopeptide (TPR) repeat protein
MLISVLAVRFLDGDRLKATDELRAFYGEIRQAKFAEAQGTISDAIRLWPENARLYAWRGYARAQTLPSQCNGTGLSTAQPSALSPAIADYERAIQLNDIDAVAQHNLGWLYHLLGQNDEAGHALKRAVELDPSNAVFHLSLGMWLEESGDKQYSSEYAKAIELAPGITDSPFFVDLRARDAAQANRVVSEARSHIEELLRRGSDPILEARLGKLYLASKQESDAERELNEAVSQLPTLSRAWFNLGEAYRLRGQTTLALTAYRKAHVLDGHMPDVEVRLGQLSEQDGDSTAAVQLFKRSLAHWQLMTPVTAAHNYRLYGGPAQTIDDLLPTTLLWYTTPCTASESFAGLARLEPAQAQYRKSVAICSQLPIPHRSLRADLRDSQHAR